MGVVDVLDVVGVVDVAPELPAGVVSVLLAPHAERPVAASIASTVVMRWFMFSPLRLPGFSVPY
jgi:hypothetical protein